jgi:hypothetical protein
MNESHPHGQFRAKPLGGQKVAQAQLADLGKHKAGNDGRDDAEACFGKAKIASSAATTISHTAIRPIPLQVQHDARAR